MGSCFEINCIQINSIHIEWIQNTNIHNAFVSLEDLDSDSNVCVSVGWSTTLSRLKYFMKFCIYLWFSEDFEDPLDIWDFELNISTTVVWIAIKNANILN